MSREKLGEYELLERLGQGGMAQVWKARAVGPAGFTRVLVIKRILPHFAADPGFVDMFISEARISARLMHANIVQVFGFGEDQGEYYLAMEYVEGRDLVTTLRKMIPKGPPEPGLAAFAVREVCRALAYAHSLSDDNGRPLKIIHRDVSPGNVMLGFNGGVKLLDFGVAKVMAADKTNTRTLRGKFGYMAPEQVAGQAFDHRVDLFAAGVVLHETLVGRRLFLGQGQLETMELVRAARVERPSKLNPDVPPALDAICLKALARDPEARYQSGAEMAMALDEVVHGLKWGPERMAAALRAAFHEDGGAPVTEPHAQPPTVISPEVTRAVMRGRLIFPAAAAAALALAGAGVWLLRPHARSEARAIAPAAAASATVASPSAPVAANANPPVAANANAPVAVAAREDEKSAEAPVTVSVASVPAGAEVFVGGERQARGRTPLLFALPAGSDKTRLRLVAPRFAPLDTEISTTNDTQLRVALVPLPARRAPVVAAKKPAKPPVAQAARGDLADPFSRH